MKCDVLASARADHVHSERGAYLIISISISLLSQHAGAQDYASGQPANTQTAFRVRSR